MARAVVALGDLCLWKAHKRLFISQILSHMQLSITYPRHMTLLLVEHTSLPQILSCMTVLFSPLDCDDLRDAVKFCADGLG